MKFNAVLESGISYTGLALEIKNDHVQQQQKLLPLQEHLAMYQACCCWSGELLYISMCLHALLLIKKFLLQHAVKLLY